MTLVEVLVALGISTMVLTAVLGAFVHIGRSGFDAGNYAEIEARSRRAIDTFTRDVREAKTVLWTGPQRVTFTIPTAAGTATVVYGVEADAASPASSVLFRQVDGAKAVVLRGVRDLEIVRYAFADGEPVPAASDLETRQLQLAFRIAANGAADDARTASTSSARVVLRNKKT